MANTYLTRTFQSGGNRKKWTMSMWVKRCNLGADQKLFQTYVSTYTHCPFDSSDRFQFQDGNGGNKVTKMKFRDTSAWYHIVVAIDTDLSTADDRYKIYVNGERITVFDTSTNPSQGYEGEWNKAQQMNIGRHGAGSGYLDACLSHIHFCDGYHYQASDFGSTDSTTGEWKINTDPNVSYGTTGFFILKDGNSVTDQSGNSNNWTANGSLTNTEDNPSNIFCTLNQNTSKSKPTLSIGNLKTGSSSDGQYVFGTIGSKAGYYEIELGENPNGSNGKGLTFGTFDSNYGDSTVSTASYRAFRTNYAYATTYSTDDTGGGHSWQNVDTGVSAAAGDIINVAWKNGKLYVGKNGTYFFNADPSNNTDGSTQVPLEDSNAYQLPISKSNVDGMTNSEWNFGNGYFGTTAVTSNSGNGYSDANGQGKFQYQPPTGCYALCTKNLNV